jgi:hypothetical protein
MTTFKGRGELAARTETPLQLTTMGAFESASPVLLACPEQRKKRPGNDPSANIPVLSLPLSGNRGRWQIGPPACVLDPFDDMSGPVARFMYHTVIPLNLVLGASRRHL